MMSLASLFNFDVDSDSVQIGSYIIERQDVYNFLSIIIKVLVILIAMYLTIKIGNRIIERYVSKQKNFKFSLDDKKAKTIGAILKSVVRYSVYFVGVLSIIQVSFGNIGLTFASIGGVAIGFGSQSLVKDVINGFFILFEDHFAVGDYIHIDDKGGIVESIELRVTKIRDFNGDLHIIPNGLIAKVTNHSRGNMRIQVDVEISYSEDVDKAIDIISKLCDKFRKENENVTEGPSVLGVQSFKEGGVTIRVAGKAKPMTQWNTEMKLRKEIGETLKNENINMHYPKVTLVKE